MTTTASASLMLCACGCGRSIAHKRRGAKTFGAACRKRLTRSQRQPSTRPSDAAQPVRRVVYTRISDPTAHDVLRRCGSWPESSDAGDARTLLAAAEELGITLTDSQASGVLGRWGAPTEALEAMAAARRRQMAA